MFTFKFNKGNLSAESDMALYYAQYKRDFTLKGNPLYAKRFLLSNIVAT